MARVSNTQEIPLTLAITAGAYSAGDVVGGLMTFNFPNESGGGEIRSFHIYDDDNEVAAMTLYLFDSAPTTIADNAVFASAFTYADHKKLLAIVPIATTDYTTINSNATMIKALSVPYNCATIYGYLVTVGTPTYTATADLSVALFRWAD